MVQERESQTKVKPIDTIEEVSKRYPEVGTEEERREELFLKEK